MSSVIDRLNEALEGRYRVERELGEGGMATVYLAEDVRHDRKVALKVLKPELAAVVGAERFLAEIKTTAQLQHPHILPLHDSGEADGFLFYVMPYVEGESLRERLDRESQLPVDEAVEITRKVASALEYAHEQGVIHRDVKPANILLSRGEPLVADFGIALAVGSAGGARLTETGLSLGTPYYMSPEQAMGDQTVTVASDIYALACVLFELLAGDPPYTGSSAQAVLARIITGEGGSVRDQRPSTPAHVDGAIRKALERLPADRFPSVADFAAALVDPGFRYGDGDSAATATRRWVRAVGWMAVGLVLGMLGGVVIAQSGGPADSGAAAGARPIQLTFSGQAARPAISPDGGLVAFVDEACLQGSFGVCTHSLAVQEVGATRAVTVLDGARFLGTPRWTHDGSSIVVSGYLDETRTGVFIVPRTGGAVRSVAPDGVFDTHPTGDSLVVVPREQDEAAPHALVMDLGSGAVTDSIPLPDPDILNVAWHPDGEVMAILTGTRLRTLGRSGEVLDERGYIDRSDIRWSVGGGHLLFFRVGAVREDDLVRLAVDDNGRFAEMMEVVRGGVPTLYRGQFDLARSTGRVAVSTGDARGDLWVFDIRGSDAVGTRRAGGTTWYGYPDISGDGRQIYYHRGDAVGDNAYVLDLESGVEEALTATASPGGARTVISPSGDRMAQGRRGEGRSMVEVVELPSRRVSTTHLDHSFWVAVPFGEQSFLLAGEEFDVLDSVGVDPRPLGLPGPVNPGVVALSPDARRFGFLRELSDGGHVISTGAVAGGDVQELQRVGAPEAPPGLSWASDGTLYAGRWLPGDPFPSLWRWSEAGGRLVRVAELQAPCIPESFRVDDGGTRVVCQTEEHRYDVWAFDGLGR